MLVQKEADFPDLLWLQGPLCPNHPARVPGLAGCGCRYCIFGVHRHSPSAGVARLRMRLPRRMIIGVHPRRSSGQAAVDLNLVVRHWARECQLVLESAVHPPYNR